MFGSHLAAGIEDAHAQPHRLYAVLISEVGLYVYLIVVLGGYIKWVPLKIESLGSKDNVHVAIESTAGVPA